MLLYAINYVSLYSSPLLGSPLVMNLSPILTKRSSCQSSAFYLHDICLIIRLPVPCLKPHNYFNNVQSLLSSATVTAICVANVNKCNYVAATLTCTYIQFQTLAHMARTPAKPHPFHALETLIDCHRRVLTCRLPFD